MLTYVINTSENKTFDSSRLFDLAGYSKIQWIQCSLSDIPKCAEQIFEKQNNITADDFRIAVIVDFFGFDRIRIPYGRRGFASDDGVDMSIYMPYIEVYLMDNLIVQLENREIFASDFEIYYIQNEKNDRYELFKSASSQIKQILSGKEGKREPTREEIELIADREISDRDADALLNKEKRLSNAKKEKNRELDEEDNATAAEMQKQERRERIEKKVEMLMRERTYDELTLYSSYSLYCTPSISLEFRLVDYPYGALEMNFEDFWDAFRDRVAIRAGIRRHYYIAPYGGGASRAALYTLTLSLYLIHLYEREESTVGEGEIDIGHLDSKTLCEVLENGWCKINSAKEQVKKNDIEYYSLDFDSANAAKWDDEEDNNAENGIKRELAKLPKEITQTNKSAEQLYKEIESFSLRDSMALKERNRSEFDKIMSEYLRARDETREADIEAEFNELKQAGFLKMTDKCPSKEQYNHVVGEKQKRISELFERVLSSEYIEVDYAEEKKRADEAYVEYKKAKAMMKHNILGDLLLLLLSVASMIVPYYFFQVKMASSTIAPWILMLSTAGFFAALFVLSLIFCLLPIVRRLNKAKNRLYNCYLNCCAKENYSFSSIKRRYERDLIAIEQARYELRQIKNLFDENLAREKNVFMHRDMLDRIADCLSSILNNLDIEPTVDESDSVEVEFNAGKSLYARENKVYQIFSIETIEKMFRKKGRDMK